MVDNVISLRDQFRPVPELVTRRIMLASDFWGMEKEPAPDVVDGVIPTRTATLLAGRAGFGKTYMMQMLMIAAAVGRDWLGCPVRMCKSLGIFAEDPKEKLQERQERICKHYGIDDIDLANTVNIMPNDDKDFVLFSCFRQHGDGKPRTLWHQIEEFCAEEGIELIILDNAQNIFEGNPGAPRHVNSFLRWFNARARALNCAIVILTNPPKDRSNYFSGIQTWENSARHTLSLSALVDQQGKDIDGELRLKVEKSNYLPYNHPLKRKGITLGWDDNVLVHRPTNEPSLLDQLGRMDLDFRITKAVRHSVDILGHVFAANPQSPNYLPGKLAGQKQWQHIAYADLVAAVERLLTDGPLVKVNVKDTWLIRARDGQRYLGEAAS